jgi:DNA-binding transcriptional LysR family regulator
MLDPRRLRVLREFAAQGTVAAAADALSFTPSAVSQQLATLQREAGVQLFERVGRRLELTAAGRALADDAVAVLSRLEEAEAALAARTGEVRGTVRIAAFQTATLSVVLPALSRLAAAHPELRVELLEDEAERALPMVERGTLDLAIAEEYEHAPRRRRPGLDHLDLRSDEMVLVLPREHPRAAGRGPVALASLADAAWATAQPGTAFADTFARLCRSLGGFEPDIKHRANDIRILVDLIAARQAVAILPALGRPEDDPRVAVRPMAEGAYRRRIFVALRSAARKRPSLVAVLDALRAEA